MHRKIRAFSYLDNNQYTPNIQTYGLFFFYINQTYKKILKYNNIKSNEKDFIYIPTFEF